MSWEQLRSIVQQNREEHRFWASQPPRACPNDGTPLLTVPGGTGEHAAPGGALRCPFDGWEYPRDFDPAVHAGM